MAAPPVSRSSTISFVGTVAMFVSSYSPLFVVLAIQAHDWRVSVGLLAGAALGVLGLEVILREARKTSPEVVEARSVEPKSAEIAAYLASYLIGFVTNGLTDWRDASAFGIYLIVLAVVYARTGLIYINPVLALQGYKLVSATAGSEQDAASVVVITKNDSVRPRNLKGVRLINGVYLEVS